MNGGMAGYGGRMAGPTSPTATMTLGAGDLEADASGFNLDYLAPGIEDLDPNLMAGYTVLYERDVPFELRAATGQNDPAEVGALEAIHVKILRKGDEAQPSVVRVELTCDSNLYFHYACDLSGQGFKELQEAQGLMVDFGGAAAMLMRMFNTCIKEPHMHLAVFLMTPTGEARLDFIQNMEYKFVELLSLKFAASPEDVVRLHVSYKYNVMKMRMQLMQQRLVDISAMLKVKNPSLLLQLQRTPSRMPPPANSPPAPVSSAYASAAARQPFR